MFLNSKGVLGGTYWIVCKNVINRKYLDIDLFGDGGYNNLVCRIRHICVLKNAV